MQPLFIILLAPVFASLWMRLGAREPSSPAKFAYGCCSSASASCVVPRGAHVRDHGVRVSPLWLGRPLFPAHARRARLSPVGLSTVTKLAPERLLGSMMGVWFLSLSLGNFIGGRIAGLFETFPLPQLFGDRCSLTTAVSALVLALLVKPIRRLMGGVH